MELASFHFGKAEIIGARQGPEEAKTSFTPGMKIFGSRGNGFRSLTEIFSNCTYARDVQLLWGYVKPISFARTSHVWDCQLLYADLIQKVLFATGNENQGGKRQARRLAKQ